MESKAWLICSTVVTCWTTGWVVLREASWIACSRPLIRPSRGSHSGCRAAVALVDIQEAKPSFSQRSSHQAMVTRSPNHWCAISCAATSKIDCWRAGVVIAGSTSRMFSNEKIAPQFSIAPKNWLVPGPATLSSLGGGEGGPEDLFYAGGSGAVL